MHELSLAEHVLGIIDESARERDFRRVRKIVLEIGRFAAVDADAMRFCFDVAARDTIAAGASLEIIDVPGQGWCRRCYRAFELTEVFDACPDCGSDDVEVRCGRELRVKTLEVD